MSEKPATDFFPKTVRLNSASEFWCEHRTFARPFEELEVDKRGVETWFQKGNERGFLMQQGEKTVGVRHGNRSEAMEGTCGKPKTDGWFHMNQRISRKLQKLTSSRLFPVSDRGLSHAHVELREMLGHPKIHGAWFHVKRERVVSDRT